jgi:predicted MPP superfamily phosphohydrolase
VLGNHDIAETRDPFSEAGDLSALGETGTMLLADSARSFDARGVHVQVAGVDAVTFLAGLARPSELADPTARLKILLSHFPEVVELVPPGSYDLVLAGHLHGGQICLPGRRGKIRLSHIRGDYWEGLFETQGGMLYVSRGVGTTFVPFRLFARPEVTALTLKQSMRGSTPSSTPQK